MWWPRKDLHRRVGCRQFQHRKEQEKIKIRCRDTTMQPRRVQGASNALSQIVPVWFSSTHPCLYSRRGTCTRLKSQPAETAAKTANWFADHPWEFGDYSLLWGTARTSLFSAKQRRWTYRPSSNSPTRICFLKIPEATATNLLLCKSYFLLSEQAFNVDVWK